MNITEFLEARIAEDEHRARMWDHHPDYQQEWAL